jgi:predicted O-methyltransferase YrrM
MEKYTYTHGWFLSSEIRHYIFKFINPIEKHNILEIGSYEGLSACFFSDNLLSHKDSTLTCVDPFDINDTTTPLTTSTKDIFLRNINKSENKNKISFREMYSNDFFLTNTERYDFIYIDGSHLEKDIINDMTEADKVLVTGGIMWMDDYRGGNDDTIKKVMDRFVDENKGRYITILSGYQLALRKLV